MSMTRGLRKGIVALAMVAIVATASVSTAGAITPYVGTVGGPGPATTIVSQPPATAYVGAWCSTYYRSIKIRPEANVQSGWVNGQWLTYRYWVRNNATGWSGTSGWTAPALIAGSSGSSYYPYTTLVESTFQPNTSSTWTVNVQIGYWQGSYWSYGPWLAQNYSYTGGGSSAAVHCLT